ncbi:hypothetical protein D3C73_1324620 [compost metagenome]
MLINATIAVFKNTVCQVFELFAQTLFAVDHLADFIFRMLLRRVESRGDFPEIGFQRGVNTLQAAKFVVE